MHFHLRFLQNEFQKAGLTFQHHPHRLPVMFEYYCAMVMSTIYKDPFYVWKNLSSAHIKKALADGFPLQEKGIDLFNDSFCHVGQAKFYGKNTTITYGKLATFLASDKLVGKPLRMTLLRTDHSRLSTDIEKMVERGLIEDVRVCTYEFLDRVKV
jgi:hypothetical protein